MHFLRLRYFLSSYTRDALQDTATYLDAWIITDKTTVVSNLYISLKRLIVRYGGSVTLSK